MNIARQLSLSIGSAVMAVATTVIPAAAADEPDRTALIVCGTTCPTPDATFIDVVKNQYIAPTHPGEDIAYVPVTTPQQMWPVTGIMRLIGLALGDPRLFGFGGPAWPDESVWKLSGLFDLTANQSLQAGAADLEAAITARGTDPLVIYGLSQGAGVANVVKKRLAERYPVGTIAPDIQFVLSGDPNLPNGGLMSRFGGAYIPILDFPFNGAAATDTPFTTIEINRQYDGFTDFPLYPLNLVATANAVLGILYLHTNFFDVSLPPDPTTSSAYQGTHGDTSYYFFATENLPLFNPLRSLGVPEAMIDVVEPFFRVIVEAGYDRSIKPWETTPARLIPAITPQKFAADLADAIDTGMDNARAALRTPPRSANPLRAQSTSHAVARPKPRSAMPAKAVTAASGPSRPAPRTQATPASHDSDRDGRGASARHR
ncbi:PE-PPE domain-containing protein [Mycobacterium sp. shizuoka-1]|uniref:PE-PPE domain-containing protein n=1 Tax=Mycobacterium sp. shizuoka-1 TaxID=2039281 RepID=UPI000C0644CE|nr:PE-PPE domain-containing protein [Mycobacterium sp. shizuoka-1]GAY15078.1 hypothetical protein MSZK_18040 [Mycobacterium sp. shizuoka-1]